MTCFDRAKGANDVSRDMNVCCVELMFNSAEHTTAGGAHFRLPRHEKLATDLCGDSSSTLLLPGTNCLLVNAKISMMSID